MSARLIILVVVAGGLAVYFATRTSTPAAEAEDSDIVVFLGADGQSLADTRAISVLIGDQPISGTEPADPPIFNVQVEVDTSRGKNRLYFMISEAHGYYADTFHIIAWRKGPGVTGPENSPLVVPAMLNEYLKANETLKTCLEVTPSELSRVDGDIGRTEDWEARVSHHGRTREKNPDPLPRIPATPACRD